MKVEFTGGAKKRAAMQMKAGEDPQAPKALLTNLIHEVNSRIEAALKVTDNEKATIDLKQHRMELHAEYVHE